MPPRILTLGAGPNGLDVALRYHEFGHIPYPFQQHIDHLPQEISKHCRQNYENGTEEQFTTQDFKTWHKNKFGPDQCRIFFYPYNRKARGLPLTQLSSAWMDQRISPPSHVKQLKHWWGPNSSFHYPAQGGMGRPFQGPAQRISGNIRYDQEVIAVDPVNRSITNADGSTDTFDMLISTFLLTHITTSLLPNPPESIKSSAHSLRWNIWIIACYREWRLSIISCWIKKKPYTGCHEYKH